MKDPEDYFFNVEVKCKKCGCPFVTGHTEVDRIVKCPKGHTTIVRASIQTISPPKITPCEEDD